MNFSSYTRLVTQEMGKSYFNKGRNYNPYCEEVQGEVNPLYYWFQCGYLQANIEALELVVDHIDLSDTPVPVIDELASLMDKLSDAS